MAQTAPRKSALISHGRVAENRRARFDYFIEDTVEAGLALVGSEVKSLRLGRASIGEAFAQPDGREMYLHNAHIPSYPGAMFPHEERRKRKLLLKKREIDRLAAAVSRKGMTVVPLALFFNDKGLAKIQLGLARGKKHGDRRDTIKKREWERDKARLMRGKG
ncbi:MAG: SsrA-binding protein SmpB [Rhodospirillaceae bacterium]|nr:SsrA-binding protein SmpB [Rhodospirillaceae bacterium]